ncbi:hypothetical protein IV102_10895 [bacterium]|nr:hypothetical protein [bacterium]
MRGVDLKLLSGGQVDGARLQPAHVGAVVGLGHGEAAQLSKAPGVLQPGSVVQAAQAGDGPLHQTHVDAKFDEQGHVKMDQAAGQLEQFFPVAAVLARQPQSAQAQVGQLSAPVLHRPTVFGHGFAGIGGELGQHFPVLTWNFS